jgi:hypothetical protein
MLTLAPEVTSTSLAYPRTYTIAGLSDRFDHKEISQTLAHRPFPERFVIASHPGFHRREDRRRFSSFSDAEFLKRTKTALSNKHFAHEFKFESFIALACITNLPLIVTVACEKATQHRNGIWSLIPTGGPDGSYARYLRLSVAKNLPVLFLPTNNNDGSLFSLRFTPTREDRVSELDSILKAHADEVTSALSNRSHYVIGGAIGICMADTLKTLNLSPADCQLWDQFAYSNFEEDGLPPGGWENWRKRILNRTSQFSFDQLDLFFRMRGPTTRLELARLGAPTSGFA